MIRPIQKLKKAVKLINLLNCFKHNSVIAQNIHIPLLKPSCDRTNKDLKQIEEFLLSLNCFKEVLQEYGYRIFQCLSKVVYFRRIEKDINCYQSNMDSETLFVILSGCVSIIGEYQEKQADQNLINNKITLQKSKKEIVKINCLRRKDVLGCDIVNQTLQKSNLIYISIKKTEFICLQRNQWRQILEEQNCPIFGDKLKFIQKLTFFNGRSETQISKLIHHFTLIKIKKNDILYQYDDVCGGIFFLKEGQISLFKKIKTIVKKNSNDNDLYDKLIISKNKQFRDTMLLLLGEGAILGDEPIRNNNNREYRAVCYTQEAQLYCIGKELLENLISNQQNYRVLVDMSYTNKQWLDHREQRIQDFNHSKSLHKHQTSTQIVSQIHQKINCEQQIASIIPQSIIKTYSNITAHLSKDDLNRPCKVNLFTAVDSLNSLPNRQLITHFRSDSKKNIISNEQKSLRLGIFETGRLLGLKSQSQQELKEMRVSKIKKSREQISQSQKLDHFRINQQQLNQQRIHLNYSSEKKINSDLQNSHLNYNNQTKDFNQEKSHLNYKSAKNINYYQEKSHLTFKSRKDIDLEKSHLNYNSENDINLGKSHLNYDSAKDINLVSSVKISNYKSENFIALTIPQTKKFRTLSNSMPVLNADKLLNSKQQFYPNQMQKSGGNIYQFQFDINSSQRLQKRIGFSFKRFCSIAQSQMKQDTAQNTTTFKQIKNNFSKYINKKLN